MKKPLTLYHAVPSRGFVAHWALEEIGAPFEMRVLDMEKQEHKAASFLTINPLGRVPTLVHDGQIVTETAAIVAYLAELFPDSELDVPAGSRDRGDYLRWMHFGAGTAEGAIAWAMLGDAVSALPYQPFASAEEVATTLEQALHGREYLVGNRFTAADIVIGSTLNWGLNMVPALPPNPVLTDYWSRLAARPAWQRVAATIPT